MNHSLMKNRWVWLWLVLLLGVHGGNAAAQAQPAPPAPSQAPGAAVAQQISVLTGMAISPLLGASAYGGYRWYQWRKAPEAARKPLPWFAHPWFWVTGLVIVGACFLKDTLGNAMPAAIKKPFDVLEALENKFSGLLATGAVVPFLILLTGDSESSQAVWSAMGVAMVDLTWLYKLLVIPVAMLAFFFVFLAANSINVLILLSPFTTVDTLLKGIRLALLGSVAGSAFLNPWIGAAWALVIIIGSYLIAGWSFRLSHYGAVYLWDFLTLRNKRFKPKPDRNRLFLGRSINKVPARTYGVLRRNDAGQLTLHYRPWLIFHRQTLTLPSGTYAVGRGAINSEILKVDGEKTQTTLLLPPRYRGHEAELSNLYGLLGVRPVGLHAALKWLKELFSRKAPALTG